MGFQAPILYWGWKAWGFTGSDSVLGVESLGLQAPILYWGWKAWAFRLRFCIGGGKPWVAGSDFELEVESLGFQAPILYWG